MVYRDDTLALSARRAALADELAETARELDAAERSLDQARGRARLPVLDNLHIAAPCNADWNRMVGDERARHCAECKKDVFNLSGMTRAQAEALLREKTGELCVRYYQRHDGTILLADCEIGTRRRRRRQRLVAAGAASLLAGGAAAYALHQPVAMMGDARQVSQRDLPEREAPAVLGSLGAWDATAHEPPPPIAPTPAPIPTTTPRAKPPIVHPPVYKMGAMYRSDEDPFHK